MSHGVEWALHCCVDLAWLAQEDKAVPAARLAAFHDLPSAYLNKHLQALSRAGIVTSTPGKNGGFRLALPPDQVSLLDVVTAVEGPEPAFRCMEIRRQGPGAVSGPERSACTITQAMRRAELAWRRELAGSTVAYIAATVELKSPDTSARTRRWFANA